MNRPQFLADEDFRNSIVFAVRRTAPVEIATVRDQGIASASDEEVLDFAFRERWLVVSKDGRNIHGLFLAPQSRATRPVAECLVLIWSASEFEEWQNRIVYIPF